MGRFGVPLFWGVSEAADKLSRPDILSLGSTEEASYRYLGLGMFVGVDYGK